jgi:hypothetical protein
VRNAILVLFCLLGSSCSAPAQKAPVRTNPTKTMERFNIARFDEHKEDNEYSFAGPDGRLIRQLEYPERREYMEEVRDPRTPYMKVKVYYMETGTIKVSGDRFYNANINTWQYFATNGSVDRQVNHEAKYKFTVADLIAKMKASYGIDLMSKESKADVERDDDEGRPLYIVTFPMGPASPGKVYIVAISGANGAEVEKTTSTVKH